MAEIRLQKCLVSPARLAFFLLLSIALSGPATLLSAGPKPAPPRFGSRYNGNGQITNPRQVVTEGQPKPTTTLYLKATLSPADELPPVINADSSGVADAAIQLVATTDYAGDVLKATANFSVAFCQFPVNEQLIGVEFHRAPAGQAGPVVFDPGLAPVVMLAASCLPLPQEAGPKLLEVPPDLAQQIIADSSAFYVEMHTDLNPQGAARGQLLTLRAERLANFNAELLPANEVPPVTDRDAAGSGTVNMILILTQLSGANYTGEIEFHLSLTDFRRKDYLLSVEFGRAAASQSGPAVLHVLFTNPMRMKGGAADIRVIMVAVPYETVQQIYNDPSNFYFQIKTDFTPDGAARGQIQRGGPNP